MIQYFALQCTTQEERQLALSLYNHLQLLKTPAEFPAAIKKVQVANPVQTDWFDPLVQAITAYFRQEPGQPYYNNALHDFLSDIFDRQFENFILDGDFTSSLAGFSPEELSSPHWRWVRLLDTRSAQCKAVPRVVYPEMLAQLHPLDQISDETGNALIVAYINRYIRGMQFSQFVNWHLRSRALFVVDNESLQKDVQAEMIGIVHHYVALGASAMDITNAIKRRLNVHPYYNAFLSRWVDAQYEISRIL